MRRRTVPSGVRAETPRPSETSPMATAPAVVKEIIGFLEAHAGATRQQVLEGLRPGTDPEVPAAAELLLHLGNLVANGGVIEFFNGTLALPRSAPKPAAAPAPEAPPAAVPAEPAAAAAAAPAGAEPVPVEPAAPVAPVEEAGQPE